MRLYHGSPVQGLKEIIPAKNIYDNNTNLKKRVYASQDIRFASCFGAKWKDSNAALGSWDNWKTVIFGISDNLKLDEPCSLYEVYNNGFRQIKTREYISNKRVIVKREIQYYSFKDMLLDNGVKLVTLDEYKANINNPNPIFHYIE